MTTQKTDRTSFLQDWIARWLPTTDLGGSFSLVPLAGDGSTRQFYRLLVEDHSLVLLSDPDWTLSKDYAPHQAYLSERGIPVPDFAKVDASSGVLVMEDMGDELLQNRILARPSDREKWITSAIELLAKLHGETYPVPRDLPIASRRFDKEKYGAEFAFTFEHLSGGFLGFENKMPAGVGPYLEQIEKVGPDVFAHRDYHTRNILICNEKLFLIDFQDARLGPPHYDLASILFDPYVPLNDTLRQRLKQTYFDRLKPYAVSTEIEHQSFDAALAAVGYQRMVKAAGSFASFYTRNGKSTHLPYLIPALKTAQELLGKFDAPKSLAEAIPLQRWIDRAAEVLASKEHR